MQEKINTIKYYGLFFNNFAKEIIIIKTQNLLLSVEITFVMLRAWYLLSEDLFQISESALAVYH